MSLNNLAQVISEGSADDVSDLLEEVFENVEAIEQSEEMQERIAMLLSGLIPALIWEQENAEDELAPDTLPEQLSLGNIVRLAHDVRVPEAMSEVLQEYLHMLPGYEDDLYDEDGSPQGDTEACEAQHDKVIALFEEAIAD